MARHLKAHGHEVVYNRTQSKAQLWVSENRGRSATPAEAARGQDIVCVRCVGNDP